MSCDEVRREDHPHRLAADDVAAIHLDHAPAAPGHVLVIPHEHVADLWHRTVHRAASLLRERLDPEGLTIVEACRQAGWQSVFHLHVHVIPRWHDDGLRTMWSGQLDDPANLEQMAARLRPE